MLRLSLSRTVLATTAAAAALAATAGTAAAQAPVPVSPADLRPVSSDVKILGADGGVVDHRSCSWTEPQADDMPCIRFSSDPKVALDEILAAGGVGAKVHMTSEGLDTVQRISRRADGTWLMRTRGTARGKKVDAGAVCSADGETCRYWEVEKGQTAPDQVRAAAARLKKV